MEQVTAGHATHSQMNGRINLNTRCSRMDCIFLEWNTLKGMCENRFSHVCPIYLQSLNLGGQHEATA
jgi:hypothetical protein